MLLNYVLVLGAAHSGKLRLCDLVLNSQKLDYIDDATHSGIIIKTKLETKYYAASLNLLIDEYSPSRLNDDESSSDKISHLQKWFDEFKSPETKELWDVLNGFILTIDLDNLELDYANKCIQITAKVKEILEDIGNEVFTVIVGISELVVDYEEIEDLTLSNGLEFIYFNESGQNEFKDKIGKDRILEIFESHEWNHIDVENIDYKQHKLDKMKDMTTKLLNSNNDDNTEFDLDDILSKLKIAKQKAKSFNDDDAKSQYVNKIIEGIIDSI